MAATIALPRPLAPQPVARVRLQLWPEWLSLSLYASIVAYAIPFHEPWADEAQAWQLARALSVPDLFLHAVRYEGTPGLWHLLLRELVLLHVSYVQMHWIAGFIAACGMSLLIFFAPFPRWVRLSLPFTVFFAFQWAVVARSYTLVPLLAFSAAIFWKRNGTAVALLLGLLANTSLHGLTLAIALCIVYLVEARRGLRSWQHIGSFLAVAVTLIGIAIFTVFPLPSDLSFFTDSLHQPLLIHVLAAVPVGAVYLMRAASCWWLLSGVIVTLVMWLIYREAGPLYLAPIISVALFSGFAYFNYWHLGFAITAVITTAWITWRPCKPGVRLLASFVFTAWMAVQLSYAAFALVWDHNLPFAPDAAASRYLQHFVDQNRLLAVTVANTNDDGEFHSVGLGPYFGKPIFINQPHLYWFWSSKEHTYSQFNAALDQDPAAVVAMFRADNGQAFNRSHDLSSRRLEALYQRGYGVTHIFCGLQPEELRLHEEICEIVLER